VCLPGGIWKDPACVKPAECQWPRNGGLLHLCAGFEYIAQPGDTLSSIAAGVCEVSLTSVTSVNPQIADITKICPGDSVCCPVCKASTLPAPPSGSRWSANNCSRTVSGGVCVGTCKTGFLPHGSAPSSSCSNGSFAAPSGGCAEACTIKIQHIDDSGIPNAVPDVLVLTDLVLVARDRTAMAYSSLSATLSSTNRSFPIQHCFDNNSTTRCSTSAGDMNASLTIHYPCLKGLSVVRVVNRKDCCRSTINKFKLVFVKSVNGTAPAYIFKDGLARYNVAGPNPP